MFSASRLSVARKRRQITKKELAIKSGISAVHLTRLESGQSVDPSEDTVRAISEALKYPLGFFYADDCEQITPEAVSFRSLSTLSARQRDAALAAWSIAFDLHEWVAEKFSLPEPQLPDLRDENPLVAAEALRASWGIGAKPIAHMIKLLESKGVRIFALAEQHKNVDAFSCWHSGIPFVFLNTFKSAERTRFDAAHELGHLVLHIHGSGNSRDAEREADTFASAFLINRGDLISQLQRVHSLDDLLTAKVRWGVSVAALARSAFDAELISDWQYRDLCKGISIRGYRTKEPNGMPREKSFLWRLVFESLWRDGVTRDSLAKELKVPSEEIEALVGCLLATQPEVPASLRPTLSIVGVDD